MNKRTIWQDENGLPTWFCMIVSAVVFFGGFYAFFLLMAIFEAYVNA